MSAYGALLGRTTKATPAIERNASRAGISRLICGCEACCSGWVVCITDGLSLEYFTGDAATAGALADPVVNVPISVSTLGNPVPWMSVRLPAGSIMLTVPVIPVGIVNE